MDNLIKCTEHPLDKNQRAFFTRTDLGKTECVFRGMHPHNTMLTEIIKWPGVTSATIIPYGIAIGKADLFDWDEIEPNIKRLLSAFSEPS